MTFTEKHLAATVIALLLVAVVGLLCAGKGANTAFASAPPGLPATIATSSPVAVTTTQIQVFATSSCSARIVSTGVAGVMLTFTDLQGFQPSATQGFWQAASTTVVYDSGQYGCGAVRIYSGTNQTIFVSESR